MTPPVPPDPRQSRRALQVAVALGSLSPLGFGLAGVLLGPSMVLPEGTPVAASLDSHWRFLSGVFFGLGLMFVSTIPAIERRTTRFRWAGAAIVAGGLGRLYSLLLVGTPAVAHLIGLGAELVLVPLLIAWQAKVARSYATA